jgi:hypothetical protein
MAKNLYLAIEQCVSCTNRALHAYDKIEHWLELNVWIIKVYCTLIQRCILHRAYNVLYREAERSCSSP